MPVTLTDVPKKVVALVAGPWPEGDEDAMRRLGHAWIEVGEVISNVAELTGTARKNALAAIRGEIGKALHDHGIELTGDLSDAVKGCNSLGEQLIRGALSTQLTKYIIKGSLLALAGQVAATVFVPGVGEADASAETAATRLTVRAAFRDLIANNGTDGARAAAGRLVKTVMSKGVSMGAIQGAGIPFIAETVQMTQGNRDWGDYDDQIETGLAAGAGGGLVGEIVGGKVMNGLERRFVADSAEPMGVVKRTVTRILGGAAAGGAGAIAGEAAQIPFTHQFRLEWGALMPGLVGGALATLPHALRGPASNEPLTSRSGGQTDESTTNDGQSGDGQGSGDGNSGGNAGAGDGSGAGDPAARQQAYGNAARGMRALAERGAGDMRALGERMRQFQDGLPIRAMTQGTPPRVGEQPPRVTAGDHGAAPAPDAHRNAADGMRGPGERAAAGMRAPVVSAAEGMRAPVASAAGGLRAPVDRAAGGFRALLESRMQAAGGDAGVQAPDQGVPPREDGESGAGVGTPPGSEPAGAARPEQAPTPVPESEPGQNTDLGAGQQAGVPPHGPDPADPYPPEHVVAPNRDPAFDEIPVAGPSPELMDHVVGEFPDFFDQPRSLEEVNALVDPNTPFHDLLALRAETYHRNGFDIPPSLSRENLDGFLRKIWDGRADIHNAYDVYWKYARSSSPNRFSDPNGYIRDLAQIAGDRPAGVRGARIQGKGAMLLAPSTVDDVSPSDVHFVHYRRSGNAGINSDDVDGRVYVNPRADAGADLMGAIVREIVDDPARFPGIYSAKIEGPAFARDDGLVIYVTDDQAAGQVIDWLAQYRSENPDAFMWDAPAMAYQIMPGVGYGASPLPSMNGASFGMARAAPIFDALQSGRGVDGDFSEFRDRALRELDRTGVNPRRPHRNQW